MQRLAQALTRCAAILLTAALALFSPAAAQTNPFAGGWVLQPAASTLGFQSVKNDTKVEASSFATFSGAISEEGEATIRIALDSIDTKIDLRNVRMRFLFFETFNFPEAVITVTLDPALLADLPTKRRMTLSLPYRMDLHGVTLDRTSDVTVTLISDDVVAISSAAPIPIAVADFNLADGITKLQEASGAKIVPTGSVTFDFLFQRASTAGAAPAAEPAAAAPAATALEAQGDFDAEACLGRFEILSRAGNITFRSGSAKLDASSDALLDNLFDIISRCPDMRIEVGGHTDDDGSDATNLALSERRAGSVIAYLVGKGLPAGRLAARGYGETVPFVPNDSPDNMARNRRIEFRVLQ